MKTKIALEKILPVIEEKLSIKFHMDENDKATLERKQAGDSMVIDPKDQNTCIAKITTIDTDRSGEVVVPEGMDSKDFEMNSVICWGHDYSVPPVGKAVKLQVTDKAVYAKIVFGDTDRCKEILSLVKAGIISTMSIGFVATEVISKGMPEFKKWISENASRLTNIENIRRIILKWSLLEASTVVLPCNPAAVITMKSMGISEDLMGKFEVKEAMDDEADYIQPSVCANCGKADCKGCQKEVQEVAPVEVPVEQPVATVTAEKEQLEDEKPVEKPVDEPVAAPKCSVCGTDMTVEDLTPDDNGGICLGCHAKEEVQVPDNSDSTPAEAFPSETTVTPANEVVPAVIDDVEEPYKSYWTVISEPVSVLAQKELKRRSGKIA
jgi:phage head maturation protease